MDEFSGILLVEDNPNDIELILAALSENRPVNDIYIAHDGEEALDYLLRRGAHELRPMENSRVVILDLKLPKVNGLEVLERIKTDPNLKTTPVVMLTSSCEERDLLRSYDLGANAYVVKPMSFKKSIEAVKQVGHFWTVINQTPNAMERRL
jgi:CheY-like chemotaxis protein